MPDHTNVGLIKDRVEVGLGAVWLEGALVKLFSHLLSELVGANLDG